MGIWSSINARLRSDWSNSLTPTTQCIIIAFFVIAVSLLLAKAFREHAIKQSREWTRQLPHAQIDSITPLYKIEAPSASEARLAAQAKQIRVRANLHLRVMNYFYSRYFASITLAFVLAIGAALCLLHITSVGWRSANSYVAAIFLATAAMAVVFRVSPMLYKQEDNIAANKDLYTRYVMLDNEVESYIATKRFRGTDSISVADVVEKLDSALFYLRDLPLGFNPSQIPDYSQLKIIEGQ